jgi:hypothetical protein
MSDKNRDFDVDDAFKHTSFVPDPAFKQALRGRLKHARRSSSQPITFSSSGWRRLLFVQTNERDRYGEQTIRSTPRLIPALGALMMIALFAAIIAGVLLPGGSQTVHAPIEPTVTPTPQPTLTPTAVVPAEFIADDLQDIAGVWSREYGGRTQMIQFNLDGTANIDWATQQNGDYVELISTSPDSSETRFAYQFLIRFEDGLLHMENSGGWHDTRTTRYHALFEAHIATDGDTPPVLSFDAENDEALLLSAWKDYEWHWVGPIEPKE